MKEKLKVFILISSDIRLKPKVLHKLLLRLGDQVLGVAEVKYVSDPVSQARAGKLSQREYWGTVDFLKIAIQHIGLKLMNYFPIPNHLKHRVSIANVCRFFDVPHQVVHDVNNPEFVAELQQQGPDVLISLQRQILQSPILETPSICCLNCHPSMLPKYRGPDPIFAAFNHNEPVIGITAHTMTAEIDRGRLLVQKTFDVKPHYSVLDGYMLAHDFYADVMIEAVDKISGADMNGFPEVPADAPYHASPDRQTVAAFKSRGGKMV